MGHHSPKNNPRNNIHDTISPAMAGAKYQGLLSASISRG